MPSKGKRIASRQNNLRRRRNNNANTNRSNPPGGARATAVAEPVLTPAEVPPAASPAASSVPAGASQPAGRSETQPRGRRFDRPAAYNHVGSELKRIGILSGVLVVALIAVSFVI